MALSNHKIPIITGRNNVPTTSELEPNHPNGSYLINKYNNLIDELENLNIPSNTDDLSEGNTNKYYSDTLARLAISVSGNGSYDSATGEINISNANQSVDHISLTNTSGNVDTYTIWGDAGETINIGTFTVTNGTDGANGADGQDGIDGQNGIDGQGIVATTVTDNLNGTHTVEFFTDLAKTQKVGEVILNDGVSPTVSVLTQSAYDSLGTYDANTFYVING